MHAAAAEIRALVTASMKAGRPRLSANRAEGKAPPAQQRDQPRGGFNRMPLIRARRFLVAVVHDDDVPSPHTRADSVDDAVGGAVPVPVPVPQHPPPAHQTVIELL